MVCLSHAVSCCRSPGPDTVGGCVSCPVRLGCTPCPTRHASPIAFVNCQAALQSSEGGPELTANGTRMSAVVVLRLRTGAESLSLTDASENVAFHPPMLFQY